VAAAVSTEDRGRRGSGALAALAALAATAEAELWSFHGGQVKYLETPDS